MSSVAHSFLKHCSHKHHIRYGIFQGIPSSLASASALQTGKGGEFPNQSNRISLRQWFGVDYWRKPSISFAEVRLHLGGRQQGRPCAAIGDLPGFQNVAALGDRKVDGRAQMGATVNNIAILSRASSSPVPG